MKNPHQPLTHPKEYCQYAWENDLDKKGRLELYYSLYDDIGRNVLTNPPVRVSIKWLLELMSRLGELRDKELFLLENGWKKEDMALESFTCIMWRKEDICCSEHLAYMQESLEQDKQKRKEQLEKYELEICCNKCGVDLKKYATNVNNEKFCVGYYGLIDAKASGGFESTELRDTFMYRFSLCEKCLVELFETFKVKPEMWNYM